jgi:hypothetical protein
MTLLQATLPESPIVGFAIAALVILGIWALADFLLARSDERDHVNIRKEIDRAYKSMGKDTDDGK